MTCARGVILALFFVSIFCSRAIAAPGDVTFNSTPARFTRDGVQAPPVFPATSGNLMDFEVIDLLRLNSGNALDFVASFGTNSSELFFIFEPSFFRSYLDFSSLLPADPANAYTAQIEKFRFLGRDHFYEIRRNDPDRVFMLVGGSFVNASSLIPGVPLPAETADVAIANFDPTTVEPEIVRSKTTGLIDYLVYDGSSAAFVSVPGTIPGVFGGDVEIVAADFDLDGLIDVFVGGDLSVIFGQPRLFLNQGRGNFVDSSNLLPTIPKQCINPRAVDLNRDAFPEIYCGTDSDVGTPRGNSRSALTRDFILRNDFVVQQSLTFSVVLFVDPNPGLFDTWVNAIDVDFADIDLDGDMDIVATTGLGTGVINPNDPLFQSVYVLRQDGNTLEFQAQRIFQTSFQFPVRPHRVRFADFSGDGKPDVIVGTGDRFTPGNTQGQLEAFINNY